MTRKEAREKIYAIRKAIVLPEDADFLEDIAFEMAYSNDDLTPEQTEKLDVIYNRYRDDIALPTPQGQPSVPDNNV